MMLRHPMRQRLAVLAVAVAVLAVGPGAGAQALDGPAPSVVPWPGAGPSPFWLGVNVRTIDLGAAQPMLVPPGLPRQPVLALEVIQVTPGGPAQRAGLELGDVIVEAQGRRVRLPDDLRREIAASGGLLRLRVRDMRSGRMVSISAPLDPIGGGLPTPPPGRRPVVLSGTLRRGAVAIGAETTGTTLTSGGATYELDLAARPDLVPVAERLDGFEVVVTGTLEVRRGVEVPLRRIVAVTDLRPVRPDGPRTLPLPGGGPALAPAPDGAGSLTPGRPGPRIESDRPAGASASGPL